jgi:transcriptional regulator with XRE-family HTH domain
MLFLNIMMSFAERLRSEIEYAGLNQKEFAAKAGIRKRALDGYLGVQKSMPPADVAVKLASTLGLSVEYLITGKEYKNSIDISNYLRFREILDDLAVLPEEILLPIRTMIQSAADLERGKNKAVV